MPTPLITLATDFGEGSAYVAILKGALLRGCPGARLVDLSHQLPSRPLAEAAFLLLRVYSYYPAGTIHVAGIDDSGAAERVLVARAGGQYFLGADNGILGMVLQREAANVYAVAVSPTTFLARDALAPLAGRVASGETPEALGVACADWRRLELPAAQIGPDGVHGQILHVDRFGNLLTNLTRGDLAGRKAELRVGATRITRWQTGYDRAGEGPFLLWGAEGWLEISAAGASAAEILGAKAGDAAVMRKNRSSTKIGGFSWVK